MHPTPARHPALAGPLSRSLLCAALLLCTAALPSHAADAPAAAPSEGEAARLLFVQGQSEYDLGHFAEALGLFEQAYKKRNVAALLYNIAQCHRQLGDLKMARTTYKAFLSKQPGSSFAPLAKEKLAEVEQALEAQATARGSSPTDLAPAGGDSKDAPAKADEEKPEAKTAELTPPVKAAEAARKDPAAAKDPAAKGAAAKEPGSELAKEAPKEVQKDAQKEAARDAPKPKEQGAPPSALSQAKARPAPAPAAGPAEPGRTFTWVAGGAAAVALVAGFAMGMQSKSTADSIASTEHTGAQVKQLSDDVASQAGTGNLLVGVGLGLAAVSAAFFVLHF